MSYSIDLRERVIKFIEKSGSKTKAAKVFNISRTTIHEWLLKKTKTGTLEDAKPKRGWKKLEPEALISYVQSNPDGTLKEYANHFKTSIPSVCLALKKLKITRKKRPLSTENGMKKNVKHFWSLSPRTVKKT